MPRTVRQNASGVLYHLISRFVDREWFFTEEEERACYLRLLGLALAESDWLCVAYALMSNHIHLAMIAGETAMASWVRGVHAPFVDWMNARHHRIGPMFVRGPKDFAIRPENEGAVIAYIHNNPVRAKVVDRARDSDWTSHRAYAGDVQPPPWLHLDRGLARAGFDDGETFDAWVNVTPGVSGVVKLDEIRRTVRRRGAIALGTPTAGKLATVPLFARPFAHVRPDPRRLVQLTAAAVGITEAELCSRRRSAAVLAGRRIATHCWLNLGQSGVDLAAALAVSPQAISQIGRCEIRLGDRDAYAAVVARMTVELGR